MQCVILAAGKGTRMRPLTDSLPKPLIKVAGKPILDHIVAALPMEVTQLVIIIGYKGDMIREYCGEEFHGKSVVYCAQEDFAGGTGDALRCAESVINGRFLFMYGDDIHGAKALREVVALPHAMLVAQSETPEQFGIVESNQDGTLLQIVEKPKNPKSNNINIGGFVVNKSIFSYDCPASETGERYVTDMLTGYAVDHPVHLVVQKEWLPIGKPSDIVSAEEQLKRV